jgi:arylsulfatase A-like enzyme
MPAGAPQDAPSAAIPKNIELHVQYTNMRNRPLSEAQTRELRHGYFACVSFVDSLIGKLLDELDRLGLRENTIIVLWGDHGYHLGEQDLWGKLTAFELASRVPLIVSVPGRKSAGSKSKALVELVDVYPTLCELADLPLPPHLEGVSCVPLLETPDRAWKSAAFTQVVHGDAMGSSIRTDRYRFTRWRKARSPSENVGAELYDLSISPVETENVANRPGYADLVEDLTAMLRAGWRAAVPHSVAK